VFFDHTVGPVAWTYVGLLVYVIMLFTAGTGMLSCSQRISLPGKTVADITTCLVD